MMANLRLSQDAAVRGAALIVWPENAVTLQLEQEPYFHERLTALARDAGADLLFGAPRPSGRRIFNSARLLRADGSQAHYDKRRLVPFAEAPVGRSADEAGPLERPTAFSAGSEPGLLRSVTDLGVSICHEILYPELIAESVRAGAQVLVNVANDGWLDGGYGVASRQHFAMGVFRELKQTIAECEKPNQTIRMVGIISLLHRLSRQDLLPSAKLSILYNYSLHYVNVRLCILLNTKYSLLSTRFVSVPPLSPAIYTL
jgi:apolipoprotein N-acyltransferase